MSGSSLFGASALAAWEADQAAPLNGEALYVVYPDYPVNTDTLFGYTDQVGHAGVLLISPEGLTKYYEYGRYPPGDGGRLNTYPLPNVIIGADGKATEASLKPVLKALANRSGKGHDGVVTRIRAAYFINMNFDAMNTLAAAQPAGQYDLDDFNCGHFALKIVSAGNSKIDHPNIIIDVPVNFVDEYIEEGNAEVNYNPTTGAMTIGGHDEADAKE